MAPAPIGTRSTFVLAARDDGREAWAPHRCEEAVDAWRPGWLYRLAPPKCQSADAATASAAGGTAAVTTFAGAAKTSTTVLECRAVPHGMQQIEQGGHGSTPWWQSQLPTVCCVLFLLLLVREIRKFRDERRKPASSNALEVEAAQVPLLGVAAPPTQRSSPRCRAVDVFRGTTICLMIFVNYGGGGLAPFQHSEWDGMTIADLVFPWFAWIMGFTLGLSASRSSSRRVEICSSHTIVRSTKLFALGLFLNNGSNWISWRIPGVLQSLAVAYLFVTIITQTIRRVSTVTTQRSHLLGGLGPLIALSLGLTFLLPVPGCPTGYIGPGGDSDGGRHRECTGGAHLYVDRLLFGLEHIYQTPTCQAKYHTGPFDPEGALNWLMVAVTTYMGFVGALSFSKTAPSTPRQQAWVMIVRGVGLIAASVLIGGLVAPHPWIPLNKNLWSFSFVLMASGLAKVVFATHLVVMESPFMWSGFPFAAVGRNAIFLYVMHEVLQVYAPFTIKPYADKPPPGLQVAVHNVTAVIWWIAVALWMDNRKIFITV